ncbi:uncharacterized protein [Miscanthus floridulus]|uniref:uncharacterized protein isoform X2 n=1 Tax=Miscanthus floridulus TaxID=154761 RepID=UPI00345A6D54
MAQEAHQAPVGRSRSSSSTSPDTGMWESPRQMQAHTPFPSWIAYAGTFAAGAGPAAAAAPSLPSEHGPDHAWNQSAPSVVAHGSSGYRGNYLSLLETKNVTPEMFVDDVPAACDYLGGVGADAAAASSSSMAGPASACGLLLGSVDPYSTVASSAPPAKHETASLPSPLVYSEDSVVHGSSMGCMPCYDHEEKSADDSQRQGFGAPSTAAFLQQMVPSRVELQSVLGYSGMVSERLFSFGVGSLPDAGSFSDYNRSSADFMSSNSNREEQDIRPGMGMGGRSSGSGAATSVTTRRKSEEGVAGGNTKKSKQEASHKASPPKHQVPKVKLGEKITALQQIVSPFGKTDTSSVLLETIEYIKFLHEQIRSPDTDRLRGKRVNYTVTAISPPFSFLKSSNADKYSRLLPF